MSSGAHVIATALLNLGVTHIFGIVGIPVIEVAEACIAQGIRFISFRNEQAATYAASAYGYLTGKPGVALVVGGPGVIHALSGVENAKANCFPLLLLAGSSETHQRGMGGFQELNQVAAVTPYTKFANQPSSLHTVPSMLEKAYRMAYFGRPGATYIDLPADLIQATAATPLALAPRTTVIEPPKSMADPSAIKRAAQALKSARSPLLIIGKGAAYSRAESKVREFQQTTKMAFLPSPMGKGVIPDSNKFNVSSARSAALKAADVILVLGARLNWIFHFASTPKFQPGVKIIQVDISPEEIGNSGASTDLGLNGDISLVLDQLSAELANWTSPPIHNSIVQSKQKNEQKAAAKEAPASPPLKYEPIYAAVREVLDTVDRKIVYVSEGANTMDISRSSFNLEHPRTRLDAGTNATMGVGLGYAIAAKAVDPDSVVVAIEGDSAFGFSGLEVETAVRSKLPMIIFVMNNGGVYHGYDEKQYAENGKPIPSTGLQQSTRYDVLAKSLGAQGCTVTTIDEIKQATRDALASNSVYLINVVMDSGKDKKLEFGWMASTKAKI